MSERLERFRPGSREAGVHAWVNSLEDAMQLAGNVKLNESVVMDLRKNEVTLYIKAPQKIAEKISKYIGSGKVYAAPLFSDEHPKIIGVAIRFDGSPVGALEDLPVLWPDRHVAFFGDDTKLDVLINSDVDPAGFRKIAKEGGTASTLKVNAKTGLLRIMFGKSVEPRKDTREEPWRQLYR